MKKVIEAFEEQHGKLNKDDLCLFFIDVANSPLDGFMPLDGKYGFIFNYNINPATLAHELAHGAFNLRHTFSSKAQYQLSQRTTKNLLDYTNSTELWKYQWDLIHNPETILLGFMQDEEEGAKIANETVNGYWKKLNVPEMFENKPRLTYEYIFIFDNAYIRNSHTLIKLKDGTKFLSAPKDATDGERYYSMKFENDANWYKVHLSSFSNSCLSCELTDIAATIQKNTAILAGRYVLPFEDGYILILGEDFDGNEASRIAAGGFLILEVIQVGKVFKFVKGAKIFSKGGKTINVSNRVVKQFAKEVTEETLIDISSQLFINLVNESIKNPSKSDSELFVTALDGINFKTAIIEGMISYTSLDTKTKNSLNCAKDYFSRMEKGGQALVLDIYKGSGDCFIEVGCNWAFREMKGTQAMQGVLNAFNNAKSRDVILQRFKSLTGESCFNYVETMVRNSLKSIY